MIGLVDASAWEGKIFSGDWIPTQRKLDEDPIKE